MAELSTILASGDITLINAEKIQETVYQNFGYYRAGETADVINILSANTYQVYIPNPVGLTTFVGPDYSYNPTTGVITYSGDSMEKTVIGSVSLGTPPSPNQTVHFAFAVNGNITLETSHKLESGTGLASVGFNAPADIANGDELTIEVKATATGNYSAYHGQGEII